MHELMQWTKHAGSWLRRNYPSLSLARPGLALGLAIVAAAVHVSVAAQIPTVTSSELRGDISRSGALATVGGLLLYLFLARRAFSGIARIGTGQLARRTAAVCLAGGLIGSTWALDVAIRWRLALAAADPFEVEEAMCELGVVARQRNWMLISTDRCYERDLSGDCPPFVIELAGCAVGRPPCSADWIASASVRRANLDVRGREGRWTYDFSSPSMFNLRVLAELARERHGCVLSRDLDFLRGSLALVLLPLCIAAVLWWRALARARQARRVAALAAILAVPLVYLALDAYDDDYSHTVVAAVLVLAMFWLLAAQVVSCAGARVRPNEGFAAGFLWSAILLLEPLIAFFRPDWHPQLAALNVAVLAATIGLSHAISRRAL